MHTALFIIQIALVIVSLFFLFRQNRNLKLIKAQKILIRAMSAEVEEILEQAKNGTYVEPTGEDPDDLMHIVNATKEKR